MQYIKERVLRLLETFRRYLEVSHVSSISRRYFVMNSFDGVLTALGIVLGSFSASVESPRFILAAGIGAGMAMFLSGFVGTYLTEKAERRRRLKELERDLLGTLDESIHKRAVEAASMFAALVDGISPLFSSIIVLLPFFATSAGLLGMNTAYYISVGLSLSVLFLLGVLLGRVSRGGVMAYGLKMLAAGVMVIILSMLLGVL